MFQTVKFLQSGFIDAYEEENGSPIEEKIKKGEIMEWEVLEDNDSCVDVQFGDGSVAFGIDKKMFEIIKEE
jgi:hypothetical protein